MKRYYFDVINEDGPFRDELGQDMSSREAITREVSRILSDIAREELPGREDGSILVEVRDEGGEHVFTGQLSFETRWHDPNGA